MVEQEGFCIACQARLHFISPPYCQCCGFPIFADNAENKHLCGACRYNNIHHFSKLRSALIYDEDSRRLIKNFKYQDAIYMNNSLASCMIYAGVDLIEEIDVIVPVPVHYRRLMRRKYNQSVLLAKNIARICSIPVECEILRRKRYTRYQHSLSRAQRFVNVAGVFDICNTDKLYNKIILLVDDLFTTGATAETCAKILMQAGAREVRVLTLARRI